MSTLETPDQVSPEPTWSLATALLFVALWLALLLLVNFTFFGLLAVGLDVPLAEIPEVIKTNESIAAFVAVLSVVAVALSWIGTFAILARMLKAHSRPVVLKSIGVSRPTPRWAYGAAIPVGLGLQAAGLVLVHLLNVSEDDTAIAELLKTPWGAVSVALMALVIAPVAEEVFFRGFVLPPMLRRFSLGTAMAFNGAVFAAVHVMTYGSELGYMPPLFLFGFVLSGLRAWTGSIGPGIVAHFVFNASSLLLFLLVGPTPPAGT